MKPAPFVYHAPTELSEVLSLLAQHGDEAKILAGGQSLMPMLNMRLATPQVIIDLNRVTALEYLNSNAEGGLAIGALARQRQLERSINLGHDIVTRLERQPLGEVFRLQHDLGVVHQQQRLRGDCRASARRAVRHHVRLVERLEHRVANRALVEDVDATAPSVRRADGSSSPDAVRR